MTGTLPHCPCSLAPAIGVSFHMGSSKEENKAKTRAGSNPGQQLIPRSLQHRKSLVLSPRGWRVPATSHGCICVFLAGSGRATHGTGAISAKGWRGSSRAPSMSSARGPRVRDLSKGSELISGLNLVQRVPAATWERCHRVGTGALEQDFVGQATRI